MTPASVQDCHGAVPLITKLWRWNWRLAEVWADAGYERAMVVDVCTKRGLKLTIVHTPPGQKTFQVQPMRWRVERTFAWICKCRRLSKDYEATTRSSETMVVIAMIGLMIHRLKPTD